MERGEQNKTRSLPHIGQRIVKTAVAVFFSLLYYYLRGYRGSDMPTEAVVTAIICMQPYVHSSRTYALNRMTGTLIGAAWGLLLLFLLLGFPALGYSPFVLYSLMALGVLCCLYTTVALHKPDASSLAAIVFICIVIRFPEIDTPIRDALERILGVLVGTAVAIGVNVFHLPRGRNRNLVFFIRSADLLPDRFAQLSPTVLFRLNSLHLDGARICIVSRHAPAFVVSQLSAAMLNLPMIVMDGAALYDASENRYLLTERIQETNSALLMAHLDRMGVSYFLYTIHRNRTCIFHRGTLSPTEQAVLNRLRRSPYRSYLDEEVYKPGEIVFFKIVGPEAEVDRLKNKLYTFLLCRRLRASVQPQAGAPGVSGLYIYSRKATVHRAEARLMALLREKEPELRPVELSLPAGYRSEHDAIQLLHRLTDRYAPIRLIPFRRRGE